MSGTFVSVSLSGGKDSTAMLLMMLERGEQVDEVVFFDTGWEFPEMLDHIDRLECETGLEVVRLHPKQPFDWWMLERPLTKGKHKGQRGYGFARPNARWCTKLKTTAINAHVSEVADGKEVVKCLGIAADEPGRIRDGFRYPLVEWGVDENAALAYCIARGYRWDGLYRDRRRVSCWCCPLQSLDDLRALRRGHPELWEKLLQMEDVSCNTLRIAVSAHELDERFRGEETWIREP